MKESIRRVAKAMMEFCAGDPEQIQHFTKVHAYAAFIGEGEGMDEKSLETLEIAALTHDIGIKICMEKYGKCPGGLQEKEGPAVGKKLLAECGAPEDTAERVCFLIGHHHTSIGVEALDWRILLEADFLVNGYEGKLPEEALRKGFETLFRTETGKETFRLMFGLDC